MKYRKKYFDKIVIIIHIATLLLVPCVLLYRKAAHDYLLYTYLILFSQTIVFIFYTLPMIILLRNYKAYNENLEVKMDLNNLQLTILNIVSNTQKVIPFEDILKLYRVESFNKSSVHIGDMNWFYFELVLKNGESEIITCLINEDLDKYIHQSKVRKVSKFFPYIKYSVHESFE